MSLKIDNEITMVVNNMYVHVKLNIKGDQNDNMEINITIYSPEGNIAYGSTFLSSNITIPNVKLEGIYKMIRNALEANPNYSIKWDLKDLNILIIYNNEIFSFTQMINFIQIDSAIPQLKFQLYQSTQEISQLKDQKVAIEKFCDLCNQLEEMKKIVETLKSDDVKLKEGNNTEPAVVNNTEPVVTNNT